MGTDHLVTITGGWSLWRWACLRGAGFPAATVLALENRALCAAADRYLELSTRAEASAAHAIQAVAEGIERVSGKQRDPYARVLKRLRAGDLGPSSPALDPRIDPIVAAHRELLRELTALQAAVEEAYAQALRDSGAELRALAKDPALREAVIWQNRHAFKTGIDLLDSSGESTSSKTRQRERTMANYVQRYCVKNDTIGFFGPVAWGTLAREGPPLAISPGPGLLQSRTVYFEPWAILALCRVMDENSDLKIELAPRLMPSVRLEGTKLCFPPNRTLEIPEEVSVILAACDGSSSAREISERLAASDPGIEDVYETLAELAERKVIVWSLIPPAALHAEAPLRALLERIGSPASAELATLERLSEHKRRVAGAAGDPVRLDRELGELDGAFAEAAGTDAIRRSGETYAGRTIVYEDCRRDLQFRLGERFLDELGPPLDLMLRASRWYTWTIAAEFRRRFTAAYQNLSAELGTPLVDYFAFWERVAPLFASDAHGAASPVVAPVVAELQDRWAKILHIDSGAASVARSAGELRDAVEEAFAAPCPGWPGARYHSPDVLVAAAGPEAFARGEYTVIIGEVHPGVNTPAQQLHFGQHPDPQQLVRALERDVPRPRVWSVIPKERRGRLGTIWSFVDHDFELELGDTPAARARDHVLAVGDLVIDGEGGELVVRTRDGSRRFDIIEFFADHLRIESVGHFKLAPNRRHSPRITIDRVAISREQWHFETEELPFSREASPAARFVAARAWMKSHGLPRFVFAKVSGETKPFYVDFESAVYVENLAHLLRRSNWAIFSEMFPQINETWLTDAAGRTYTSEIRLAAVDQESWRSPSMTDRV